MSSRLIVGVVPVFSVAAVSPINLQLKGLLLMQFQWIRRLLDRSIITRYVMRRASMIADTLAKGSVARD
eukprot:2961036-Lingulodinium_polyedra.AAC.1